MSIFGIAKTYRSLQRLGEIVNVLVRNGFGHYVHRLNLYERFPRLVPFRQRGRLASERPPAEGPESLAKRITIVLQELGPTFVKLGQVLSSRPDLVPEELVTELEKLQDNVEPFPGEESIAVVERETGASVEESFAEFAREPFASGSIGQVHYARLKDGSGVVVKVRRPDIERRIFLDIGLLRILMDLAEKYISELEPYRLPAIIEEFERGVRRELDFVVEASLTAKFHELFLDDEAIRTPKVYWDLTTPQVLTVERMEGIKISDYAKGEASVPKRRAVSRALAKAFCRQYFEFGTFHADPHPGNLLVDEKGRLTLLDFGLVGNLSDRLKGDLAQMLISIDREELDIFCEVFADIGATGDATDSAQLQSDLLELLNKYYSMPMKRMDTYQVFSDVTRVARRNSIVLPRDIILLAKSFVAVMTAARNLDPDFDFAAAVEPHVRGLFAQRLSPRFLLKEARNSAWHLGRLLRWLPRELSEILRKIEGGRLQFIFRHVGLDEWMAELDRSLNRLSISIIISSIVIASSLLLQSQVEARLGPVAVLGIGGYVVAFLLGCALVFAIWKSGRL